MSGKRRFLIAAAILLLVAFGAGAALASGSDAGVPKARAVVDDGGHESESPDPAETDEVEDADEPGDVDGAGAEDDDQIDEVGESEEASHPGDATEDKAEGPDQPITGPDLDQASKVALDYMGGGRVTGTEIEDEESYYEVEVTREDGSQVDVQLDEFFNVVGID